MTYQMAVHVILSVIITVSIKDLKVDVYVIEVTILHQMG